MLWTIAAILLVLWLLGLATSYTVGGVLAVALMVVIINLIRGRKAV